MSADQVDVVVQMQVDDERCPAPEVLTTWALTAISEFGASGEVTLRIVSEEEIRALNHRYRQQDKSTNVLSFPAGDEFGSCHGLIGDVVICAPVVAREAAAQGKPSAAHWAHMVTHGVLHLMGFDHIDETQADEMEAHERRILAGFGFSDPYIMDTLN